MDIYDKSWDECIDACVLYIKELEKRLKDAYTMEQREYLRFLILKEKTMVNLMSSIEHYATVYNLAPNPYMEMLCRHELILSVREECNRASCSTDNKIRDPRGKNFIGKQYKFLENENKKIPVKNINRSYEKDSGACRELKK